jgi:hypothetical protein
MGRIVLHPSPELREKSIDKVNKHYEAESGKRALLKTWDDMREGKISNPKNIDVSLEHDYLVALGKRIRKEYVLVSHSRFSPKDKNAQEG